MTSSLPDHTTVRQYLLGRLDEQPQLESDLSDGILVSDDLAEMVESIEDEIIEEYLDGTLDPADKNAVEKYFLLPPERKEKLRFARVLRHRFEARGDSGRREVGPVIDRGPGLRAYWQIAALILLGVLSLTYIVRLRERQAFLEAELSQRQEGSPSVPPQTLLSSTIGLTLVEDRSRAVGAEDARIEVNPSVQRIIVEIALSGVTPGPYEVRLEANGGKLTLWSGTLMPLLSKEGDGRLMFDVPARNLESGAYYFVVSPSHPPATSHMYYDFRATVTK